MEEGRSAIPGLLLRLLRLLLPLFFLLSDKAAWVFPVPELITPTQVVTDATRTHVMPSRLLHLAYLQKYNRLNSAKERNPGPWNVNWVGEVWSRISPTSNKASLVYTHLCLQMVMCL